MYQKLKDKYSAHICSTADGIKLKGGKKCKKLIYKTKQY